MEGINGLVGALRKPCPAGGLCLNILLRGKGAGTVLSSALPHWVRAAAEELTPWALLACSVLREAAPPPDGALR